MDLQAFQPWERRNSSDTVTRPGSYSKQTDLVNATNTGVLDYIGNNLDVLNDTQAEISTSDINALFTGTLADTSNASVVGNRLDNLDDRVSTNASSINSINSSISTLNSNVSTLSSGKLNLSGGTMTGAIIANTTPIVKKVNDNSVLSIIGGTGDLKGGIVELFGKDYSTEQYQGAIRFRACDGTNYKAIVLFKDGTTYCPTPATTSNNNNIATTAFVKAQDCSIVKYYNLGNESESKTLLSVAETYLATNTIDVVYVSVGTRYDTGSTTTSTPFTYGLATIYHKTDTVYIIGCSYANGFVFANTRSRGGTWLGWKKANMTAL